MNAYGIEFKHRRPGDPRPYAAKNFAQFTQFAALLHAHGAAQHVESVFYDTNSCCFHIEADQSVQFTDAGGAIDWCANKTLDQYDLFGTVFHKRDLDEELP